MENIALWHERDISHSSTERIILPDSCLLLDYSLALFTSIMRGLQIYPQRMKQNIELTKGLVFSQRVMPESAKSLRTGAAQCNEGMERE